MPMIDAYLAELDHESATSRRVLERVPEDRMGWKPHERSMTLGRLAGHVAELPVWAVSIVTMDVLDLASDHGMVAFNPTSREELLATFERRIAEFRAAAQGASDEHLRGHWKLAQGDKILLDMPRAVALRSFVMSHTIHHRGQLSVYLRLLDVPVPSIYGPSADDPGPFG
jgi:uncharacterized damage-inducible protein DinB